MNDPERINRENLGWLLAKASQRWNGLLVERFRETGHREVRASFGSVLVPLFEEDSLRMGELARRAGLSKQALTSLVRAVEAAGLVTRIRDPQDGRAFRVALTDRGEMLRPVAGSVLGQLEARIRTRFSDEDLARLVESLRKVAEL